MRRELLEPDWPVLLSAPCAGRVRARFTTRGVCIRDDPFASLNLGAHVGDDPARVAATRSWLAEAIGDVTIGWLDQVHGIGVVRLGAHVSAPPTADAAWTSEPRVACAILTADCLPVLVSDRRGEWVGAAHCGWRGLADGALSALIEAVPGRARDVTAWIGPGISRVRYRVGREVLDRVEAAWGPAARATVESSDGAGGLAADLEALARWQLRELGVASIHGGGFCSARDPRFYSYRRDGATGRNAALIWLE